MVRPMENFLPHFTLLFLLFPSIHLLPWWESKSLPLLLFLTILPEKEGERSSSSKFCSSSSRKREQSSPPHPAPGKLEREKILLLLLLLLLLKSRFFLSLWSSSSSSPLLLQRAKTEREERRKQTKVAHLWSSVTLVNKIVSGPKLEGTFSKAWKSHTPSFNSLCLNLHRLQQKTSVSVYNKKSSQNITLYKPSLIYLPSTIQH